MWSVIVVLKILCVLPLCQCTLAEQIIPTTDQIVTSTEPPDISDTTFRTTIAEDDASDATFQSTTPFPTTDTDTQNDVTSHTSTETVDSDDSDQEGTESSDAYSTIFLMPSSQENELLPDIEAQESKIVREMFIQFEPKKYAKLNDSVPSASVGGRVQFTSYLADSETAVPMSENEIKLNKSRGADMISAFLIAPDDEVNEIERKKYSGRPIVVSNLNDDLVRTERYSSKEERKTLNNILAPIRAGVSLSHEKHEPMIEKQELQEQPVYKTIIEIQKSIPYEIKEIEQKDERPISNDLSTQIQSLPNRPHIRSPFYYRYPMYYLPQSYIGHYIMQHSHENTHYRQPVNQPQPTAAAAVLPIQYYFRYQPVIVAHPYFLTDTNPLADFSSSVDQNTLHSDPKAVYQPPNHSPVLHQQHGPPFRPSHPLYTSQYPPYTYRVLSTMRARGARSARSKQFWVEYGGFKPPLVPSVQLEEKIQKPEDVKAVVEENTEP